MTEKQIPWEKCCFLTTDGATVITGYFLGVGARVKAVVTNCILKHCFIHREALEKTRLETRTSGVLLRLNS